MILCISENMGMDNSDIYINKIELVLNKNIILAILIVVGISIILSGCLSYIFSANYIWPLKVPPSSSLSGSSEETGDLSFLGLMDSSFVNAISNTSSMFSTKWIFMSSFIFFGISLRSGLLSNGRIASFINSR